MEKQGFFSKTFERFRNVLRVPSQVAEEERQKAQTKRVAVLAGLFVAGLVVWTQFKKGKG